MNFDITRLPITLFAHSEAHVGGLINGLTHPMLGLDHLLAMAAVGILSVQLGGRKAWKIPAAFVAMMLVGGLISFLGVSLPAVEAGILLSVLALGAALASGKKLNANWAIALVGFFALFHGHAHGSEIPALANPALYAIGFVLATTLLHAAGVLFGISAKNTVSGTVIIRYSGASIAGIGFALILGL